MGSLGDLQRPERAGKGLPVLPLDVAAVRTFDTPEFAGMTFLEVEAKSALNKVKGMMFPWSINPYRGCSHACSYCLEGGTPILMADGSTRSIADLRAGDDIYGTRRTGPDRRYVVTKVLDQWSTVKPAYRITLADGTQLTASGDHRFLTDGGWKHVTGATRGPLRRPHLTEQVRLAGPGRSEHPAPRRSGGPAVRLGRTVEGRVVEAPHALHVVSIEDLGVDLPMYDITTGTGDFVADGVVSHNCFARPTHSYLNLNPLDDFESTVVVKTNVVEVLKRELAKPSWKGEHVAMGTNTDPYQRCEGRYRLMPGIIQALAESLTPFSILTKGTLIQRDLPALQEAAGRVRVTAAMSIGTVDDAVWRTSEPGTPSPSARLATVKALNDAGIPTGVMLAPILPGLSDGREQLTELVERAVRAGATHVTPIVLHLRPGVREVFWPWLEQTHPHLVGWYHDLYRRSDAAQEYRDAITAIVAQARDAAWRRHGRPPPPPWTGSRSERAERPTTGQHTQNGAEQLELLF